MVSLVLDYGMLDYDQPFTDQQFNYQLIVGLWDFELCPASDQHFKILKIK